MFEVAYLLCHKNTYHKQMQVLDPFPDKGYSEIIKAKD
jgi:hypothetical protein